MLGPFYIELEYGKSGNIHTMRFQVEPSTEPVIGVEPTLKTRIGGSVVFSLAIGTLVLAFRAMYDTATSFTVARLMYRPEAGVTPTWYYEYPISGGFGINTTANMLAEQMTFTFRSTLGHLAHIVLLDVADIPVDTRYSPSGIAGNTRLADIVDWASDSSAIIQARDNGWLANVMTATTKTNNLLREKFKI
jgi:hypothetical protein